MSSVDSDYPPLFEPGEHEATIEKIFDICINKFPLSKTRENIFVGFSKLHDEIEQLHIPCHLIIDGSFLTEEIDPDDIDLCLVVTPEFYETCSPEQLKFLNWIRDDKNIKDKILCDVYLCVNYKSGHLEYYEGIQDHDWWVNFYSKSVVYKRVRGVAVVNYLGKIK